MTRQVAGETLYNVKELQELLGISARTVRQYFRDGKFKGRKIAREWYITETVLQEYLRGGETAKPGAKTEAASSPDEAAPDGLSVGNVCKVRITDVENTACDGNFRPPEGGG